MPCRLRERGCVCAHQIPVIAKLRVLRIYRKAQPPPQIIRGRQCPTVRYIAVLVDGVAVSGANGVCCLVCLIACDLPRLHLRPDIRDLLSVSSRQHFVIRPCATFAVAAVPSIDILMRRIICHTLYGLLGITVIVIKHGIAVGHRIPASQVRASAHICANAIGHAALLVILLLGIAGRYAVNAAVVSAVILNAAEAAFAAATGPAGAAAVGLAVGLVGAGHIRLPAAVFVVDLVLPLLRQLCPF